MLKKWERIRAKGRTRFALLRGVLFPLVGILLVLLLLVVFLPDVSNIPLRACPKTLFGLWIEV
jgi:hypothetical protein